MTNPFWAMLAYVARRFVPPRPQPLPPESPTVPQPQQPGHAPLPEESFLMAAVRRMLEARERELLRRRLVAEAEEKVAEIADKRLRAAQRRLEIDGKTVVYFPSPDFGITPSEIESPCVNRFKTRRIMSIKMNNTLPV